MEFMILLIVLIGYVYYTSYNGKIISNTERRYKEKEFFRKIGLAFILACTIVFSFIIIFDLLGLQQKEITIIVFTMILCTYSIIEEIRKLNK